MSPALADECPDTPLLALPCWPRVRAGLYTPRGSSRRGVPSHVPVEAPCSALAVDTAEERLCPCKCGRAMVCPGDKQLRAASRPYQPRGASGLSVWPQRNASPRESHTRGWARGLRSGHTQAYATLPGLSDPVIVRPPKRSQGMKVVWTLRGTPEHCDSGA